ncbi:MAG: hypothetical protein RL238_2848 [Actinomycetota bacterium]
MTDGDALRRAQALAVPTRVAVLDALRRRDEPMTAAQLAAVIGVHHTAVRQHLAVLAEVGLVAAETLPPAGRGRPKSVYRALTDPDPYQHLSLMLADAVSLGLTPREAGHRHGERVTPSPDGPLATLVGETTRLGFRPTVRDRGKGVQEVVLHTCPFADVAAVNAAAICGLHRGIAEGVLARTGGLEVVDLHVADPHKAGCRLVTRPAT